MTPIKSTDEFKQFVAAVEANQNYVKADGFVVVEKPATANDREFPYEANWQENYGSLAAFLFACGLLERDDWQHTYEVRVDIAPEMLTTLQAIFHCYWDEAIGEKHKNIQAVKRMVLAPANVGFQLVLILNASEHLTTFGKKLQLWTA